MKPTQRFIAGAACPKCHEQDAILIDSSDQSIECVECGYTQTEQERDSAQADNGKAQAVKSVPKKVDVSNIIRINQKD